MSVEHLFASIPVRDREGAIAFYERLFGAPPGLIPNDSEAAWQLTGTAWVYVIVDPARAGSALHTLLVDDLDGFVAACSGRGIASGPVEIYESGTRRLLITDPDGNRIGVGQPAV